MLPKNPKPLFLQTNPPKLATLVSLNFNSNNKILHPRNHIASTPSVRPRIRPRTKQIISSEANTETVRMHIQYTTFRLLTPLPGKEESERVTRLNGPEQSRRRDRRSNRRDIVQGRNRGRKRGRERRVRSAWNLHRAIKLHARGRASGYVSILWQTMDDPVVLFGKPVYTGWAYGYYFVVILTNRCNRVYVCMRHGRSSTCSRRDVRYCVIRKFRIDASEFLFRDTRVRVCTTCFFFFSFLLRAFYPAEFLPPFCPATSLLPFSRVLFFVSFSLKYSNSTVFLMY